MIHTKKLVQLNLIVGTHFLSREIEIFKLKIKYEKGNFSLLQYSLEKIVKV